MSATSRDNISGSGYISDNRTDDGLLKVHGVALGNNDITIGAASGEKKLWRPEVLESSFERLEGKDIVVNHENRDAYKVVGEVTDVKYDDEKGIIYQGVVQDDELEPKIERGWLDVSPRLKHSESHEEVGDAKAPDRILDFPNLSIVRKGASPSNVLEAGAHEELAENIQEEFDGEGLQAEYHHRKSVGEQYVSEELAEFGEDDYVTWDNGSAHGKVVDWTDNGVYDASIDGDVTVEGTEDDPAALIQIHQERDEGWMPTDTMVAHKFSTLNEWNPETIIEENIEAENLQLSEARMPSYSGTETSSWAEVDKTLEDFLAGASGDTSDVDEVSDLTDEQKTDIAEHTLLGEADASTLDDLLFFPVVNPNTGNLNRGALEAVRGGRGQSADIPESTMESAFEVAGRLLNEEFDTDVPEEMEPASLQDAVETVELQVSQEDLDEIYSKWSDTVNMTASQLRTWSGNPCSREASEDPEAVIERNLNLLETNKSEWTEDEIEDAERTVSFINRMRPNEPDDAREGPFGCPSEWAISLLNWAYNPFESLPNQPDNDDLDEVEELQSAVEEKKRLAGQISSFAPMTREESLSLLNTLSPDSMNEANSLVVLMNRVFDVPEEDSRRALREAGIDVGNEVEPAEEDSKLNEIFG